jgi:hypothetical protein
MVKDIRLHLLKSGAYIYIRDGLLFEDRFVYLEGQINHQNNSLTWET